MRGTGELPYRLCIFGASTPSTHALAALASKSPIAYLGPSGSTPDGVTPVEAPAVDDPLELVPLAARAFPRETLILVRADAELPTHAIERLQRALECDGVLGAAALDNLAPERSPLPTPVPADIDVERLDALCFASGERRLIDASLRGTLVSAWHGERLAQLGHASPADADALATHGLRTVVLDHLYAHAPAAAMRDARADSDPRDPPPPSPLAALRERVAAALAAGAVPDRPGLDARPVLLHVLHGWGGGAERWVRDFASAFGEASHLVLITRGSFARKRHGEWLELYDGTLKGPPRLRIPLPCPMPTCVPTEALVAKCQPKTGRCGVGLK